MKRCVKCGEAKPPAEYRPPRASCKACERAYARAWYAANRERKAASDRAYRERTREHRAAYDRAYHEKHPERRAAGWRAWYAKNRDHHAATKRAHRAKHRASYRTYNAARRARKREAFVELVDPLVVLEVADGACGICGEDVDPFAFDVDHTIPLCHGGEHSYANTQPAHPRCNYRKGTALPE